MTVGVDEEAPALALRHAPGHGHGLGRGGRFVEQRGVRHRQTGEIDDHLLEVEQGFEAPLADLGLVGCISGIPAGILEHVALDHLRHHRAVVAHADHRHVDAVAGAHLAQVGEHRLLGDRLGQRKRGVRDDIVRYRAADDVVQRSQPELAQHLGDLGLVGTDVAAHEVAALLEITQAHDALLVVRAGRRASGGGIGERRPALRRHAAPPERPLAGRAAALAPFPSQV